MFHGCIAAYIQRQQSILIHFLAEGIRLACRRCCCCCCCAVVTSATFLRPLCPTVCKRHALVDKPLPASELSSPSASVSYRSRVKSELCSNTATGGIDYCSLECQQIFTPKQCCFSPSQSPCCPPTIRICFHTSEKLSEQHTSIRFSLSIADSSSTNR